MNENLEIEYKMLTINICKGQALLRHRPKVVFNYHVNKIYTMTIIIPTSILIVIRVLNKLTAYLTTDLLRLNRFAV